jgi:CRISPR-associated protein Csd1
MYKSTAVPWVIDLDATGQLLGLVRTTGEAKRDQGKLLTVPYPGTRTAGIKANLLVDKAEYVLGLERDNKSVSRHEAFLGLVRECAESTGERDVQAVLHFLETLDLTTVDLPAELTPDLWITFRVAGSFPTDLPSVQDYWASRFKEAGAAKEQDKMNCIVCGAGCVPVSPHPGNIKGIPNGQTSGMALISANSKAFESYGLERSVIAPTCGTCAEKYVIAANTLIKDEHTHLRVGPLIYLFWTREDTGFSVTLLSKPEPDDVKALIESAWKGREYSAVDETAFYATAFSASGARVAVRDWLETTLGSVRKNLARWFVLQQIVDSWGGEGHPYGLYPLCASLYRDANRDMVPNVPKTVLRAALHGGPLPMWLLYQAVRRNRAEQGVTRPRIALIKMVLLSGVEGKEDTMKELEIENTNPAYLCGRLFAELEAVQRAAMPNVNTTIADRFFGTASSAPASVFGRLLRGAQNHLGKLRRERPGTYHALQQRLEEIQSKLSVFPTALPLKDQGMFALGYYHQRASDRAGAKAAKDKTQVQE